MAADTLLLAYVLAFGVAALVCFGSIVPARRVDDPETRRGLCWLLLFSGGWAASHVGFLLAPGEGAKTAFYLLGLVVGLATVGPWLYFCSAYTGRSLHRDRTYRQVAVGGFVVVSALKLTNPLHGLYVTATPASTPFAHLAMTPEGLHWVVAGLAYALTAFGGFALFDRFRRAGADTTPLVLLLFLVGLPIGLDLVGYVTPRLVEVTHEPLGVAVFAVGTLVLYRERFQAVRLTSDVADPVVVVDDADRIRDFNEAAVTVFPGLAGATGRPLSAVLPVLDDHLAPASASGVDTAADGSSTVAVTRDGETRYFRLSTTPAALGTASAGRRIVLTDVTAVERRNERLERQNERLERFTSGVSHDLRNPLNAASAQLELARAKFDGDSEHLENVAAEQARMEAMIADLLTLAREGRAIGETEGVSLAALARDCQERIDGVDGSLALEVAADYRFEADAERLRQVLENLFRNAAEHGATGDGNGEPRTTVRVGPLSTADGFYVADDGPGIPPERRERVFETGHTTADDGTGFGLAIVREIVEAHGWEIQVVESERGGARFEVREVEPVE